MTDRGDIEPGPLTYYSPPEEPVKTPHGIISHLEWCRAECERINRGGSPLHASVDRSEDGRVAVVLDSRTESAKSRFLAMTDTQRALKRENLTQEEQRVLAWRLPNQSRKALTAREVADILGVVHSTILKIERDAFRKMGLM